MQVSQIQNVVLQRNVNAQLHTTDKTVRHVQKVSTCYILNSQLKNVHDNKKIQFSITITQQKVNRFLVKIKKKTSLSA